MIKKKVISKKDIETWQNYLKNPTDIVNKDSYEDSKTLSNERFIYDLHGCNLEQANKKVKNIIFQCSKNKYKEILLITGKGNHSRSDEDVYVSKDLSKLKYSVPDFIKSNSEISRFISSVSTAQKKDGGVGAIIIKLKKL